MKKPPRVLFPAPSAVVMRAFAVSAVARHSPSPSSSPCGLSASAAAHFPLNSSCCRGAASPAEAKRLEDWRHARSCHPWHLLRGLVQCLAPSSHVCDSPALFKGAAFSV